MIIQKQVIDGIIPYIIIVQYGDQEYVYKKANGKRAFFRTRNAAEKRAMWISKEHPSWKLIIKQSNGVAI